MMGTSIKDRPEDMVIAMHMYRVNFQSTWAAEGTYDPVADAIFNLTGTDAFFMEYDSERAGGLEPFRLRQRYTQRTPAGYLAIKTGKLESVDEICRKVGQAARFAPLEQLGIAPQCGFASAEESNKLLSDDQRRKLDLVVNVAERMWSGITA